MTPSLQRLSSVIAKFTADTTHILDSDARRVFARGEELPDASPDVSAQTHVYPGNGHTGATKRAKEMYAGTHLAHEHLTEDGDMFESCLGE